jgi:hypothetical protein
MSSGYYDVREVLARGERIGYAGERMHYVGNLDALVGIVKGSQYALAVDLTDEKEYRAFYAACARGGWLDIELYRLPKDEIPNCPDAGWVKVAEAEALMMGYRGNNP